AGNDSLMRREQQAMAALHDPIEIPFFDNEKQFLYYKDSKLFTELQEAMDGIIRAFISETVMNAAAVPVVLTDSTQRRIVAMNNLPEEIAS
ncbi:MAG: hypothetical protein KDC02_05860, partial [Flavobacteriales bacterium]|nr:hypothetical protein [Flavobacteriales bacterium]